MDATQWQDELLNLTKLMEPQAIVLLTRIREHRRCAGLPLDDQFKRQFLDVMNNWMIRVFDRLQSPPTETNHGQSASFGEEKTEADTKENTGETNGGNLENKRISASELIGSDGVAIDEVVSSQGLEVLRSAGNEEEIRATNAHRILIEAEIEMKDEVIDKLVDCRINLSPLGELSASITASIDSTNAPESINSLETNNNYIPMSGVNAVTINTEATNSLEKTCSENSSTIPFGQVLTIDRNEPVKPLQMPDLLMNLARTKSQEASSPLKRRNSNEIDVGTEAKKHKHEGNKAHGCVVNQLMYGCAHCFETAEHKLSVEEVREHWQLEHSADLKPFQFYIAIKMRCFYCDFVASFGDIAKHHQAQHPVEPFVVVIANDSSTCGICGLTKSRRSDLIEHFSNDHESIARYDISNPISLDDEMLTELLAYNGDRYQCGSCDRVFDTQSELEFHHAIDHSDQELDMRIVNQTPEPYLICDYCQATIVDRSKYLNHIEEHCYVFKCSKCCFQTEKMMELVGHEKKEHRSNSLNFHCLQFCELLKKHFANTKLIFPNGLLLFNHQLSCTAFGNGQILFDLFIDELTEIIRQKYKSEHGVNEEHDEIDESNENISQPTGVTSLPKLKRPPISARALNMKELDAQNRLINNLCIYGIPYFKNENKNAIFLNICALLQANVSQRDIVKITRAPGRNALLIVELKQFEVKQQILQCAYMKPLWSSDLIHLPVEVPRTRIFVNIHTTKFYGRMAKIARNAMNNNKLHIFWITKFGFLVKRTKNSQDKIILSPDELIDYIKQRKKSAITREKQFYRSIAWVPTSNGD